MLSFIYSIQKNIFEESRIIDFQVLEIGEGKILNIAKYNNKKDFEETNRWLVPELTLMIKKLDSAVESIPGGVIFTYSRQINNK